MTIKSLQLQNFRSYKDQTFKFPSGTTLIVGPNTSGKTNLLEAIYLLATGKSFRAEVEAEMIRYREEIGRVRGTIVARDTFFGRAYPFAALKVADSPQKGHFAASAGEGAQLEIILTTGLVSGKKVAKKKYQVNGVGKRMIDFVGRLKAVYFGPEDLQLVTDSPSLRRRYLDMVLFQVDREYRRASLSYEKGVRQRNRILDEVQRYRGTKVQSKEEMKRRLYFWDQLLVKNGNYITGKREEFVEFLNDLSQLGKEGEEGEEGREGKEGKEGKEGRKGKFEVEYVKSIISPAALEENFQKEIVLGQTLVGPHRDDIKFVIRDTGYGIRDKKENKSSHISHITYHISPLRDLSIYGSRGEQRLVVLWLKMGELEYIAEKTDERPVLLLDDIFSELDEEHRRIVLGVLEKQQTIITTTDERMVKKDEREKMQVVHLY